MLAIPTLAPLVTCERPDYAALVKEGTVSKYRGAQGVVCGDVSDAGPYGGRGA